MADKPETEQTKKHENGETMPIIDKTTPNISKEEDAYIDENTCEVSKEMFKRTDELAGKPKRPKEKKRAFSLLDIIISVSIIGPSVIGFWRGVWNWMTLYPKVFSIWLTFILGVALSVIFAIYQNRLYNIYTNKKWVELSSQKRLLYRISRILYIYTFGVACIMHWKSGWDIVDNYLFTQMWITASSTCLFLACLAVLRCIRNLMHVPFLISIDRPSYIFLFPSRYNVSTRDWSLYLLDCAFSVGVVGTLVVFVWRGTWSLIDMYLFPGNSRYSAIGSLAIGYFIVVVTFCLQPLMRYVCTRLQGLFRLIVADAFLLLSFLGTVNVWRGIWLALDLWLLPDNLELSCWITHIGCFVLLVLLNCSNTILVRGVYIDAEEEEGKCVVFPCHYLRLFFKIEREKKQARQQKLLVASQDFDGHTDVNEKDGKNGALLPNNTAMTIISVNADSLA